MKMKVQNILISQPPPAKESSAYLELSKNPNVKIDFRPFIEVKGVSPGEVRRQKIDLSSFSAVIFTSKSAVDHYFRLWRDMRYDPPGDMKYVCQSEFISSYLIKHGVNQKRKVHTGEKYFKDMLPRIKSIIKKNEKEIFLLPSSDVLKPEVPRILSENKVNWKRAILYKTVSSDLSDLKDIFYDILAFFSPAGIKSLFENFPDFKQNSVKIATFGETTYKAASKAGLKVHIRVPTLKTPSMSMALEKYLRDHDLF